MNKIIAVVTVVSMLVNSRLYIIPPQQTQVILHCHFQFLNFSGPGPVSLKRWKYFSLYLTFWHLFASINRDNFLNDMIGICSHYIVLASAAGLRPALNLVPAGGSIATLET